MANPARALPRTVAINPGKKPIENKAGVTCAL
jgi:hypothetical protein